MEAHPRAVTTIYVADTLEAVITMNKERNYNPVQAQRKADKAKAIKKGKRDPLRSWRPAPTTDTENAHRF